ncbi:3'(2'),5'-bisphosphate nucleotidase CysQ [Corallincola platygyrae]|uniref:3'(2'),5'-bisphosphate nucleotidase CysQ n=1 Tax=Corallincola platygyrae TaxID=1193278 RepID=A0ABW4XHG3_9GAMM
MVLSQTQLEALLTLASDAAKQAGNYIASFDRSAIEVSHKTAGDSAASQVVTQVDLACEALIKEALQPSFDPFDIAFLGEESAASCPIDQHPRLNQPYFWCVDPLDGTLPFTENVPGYAVSIALVSNAGEPLIGVVFDPVTGTLYQGIAKRQGAGENALLLKQGQPWAPLIPLQAAGAPLSLYFDRSFTTLPMFSRVVEAMSVRAEKMGYSGVQIYHQAGSVMNAVQMLAHTPACYFKFPKATEGGGSLWDFAATAALAKAAGAWVSDIHGDPLQLNAPDSLFMHRRGVLYASDRQLAEQVMALYRSLCK